MTDPITLPEDLLIAIGSESKEFIVNGSRAKPLSGSLSNLILGILWVSVIIVIGYFLFTQMAPSSSGEETSSMTDGGVASNEVSPWILYVVYAFFLGFGIWHLGKTIISLLRPGGIFIGTPNKLFNYRNGELIEYTWDQFIVKTKVTGNATKGNLTLTRTTGYNTKRNQAGMSYYIPYIVYISGVADVFEIEKICKKRIKESDKLFPIENS